MRVTLQLLSTAVSSTAQTHLLASSSTACLQSGHVAVTGAPLELLLLMMAHQQSTRAGQQDSDNSSRWQQQACSKAGSTCSSCGVQCGCRRTQQPQLASRRAAATPFGEHLRQGSSSSLHLQ